MNGRRRTFDEIAATAEEEEIKAWEKIHDRRPLPAHKRREPTVSLHASRHFHHLCVLSRYKNGGGEGAGGVVRVGDDFQAAIPPVEKKKSKVKLSHSKIQGTEIARKPRVGEEFQATIPDCSGAP